jgi:hypothetical protein
MILLSTYPRTGKHLLHGYLSVQTNLTIKGTHFPKSENNFLTVSTLRNPIDTLTSHVSMHLNQTDSKKYTDEQNIKNLCILAASKYISFYNDIEKITDNIILYDRLLDDPNKTLLKFYNKNKIKPISNSLNGTKWKDNYKDGYIVSSKKLFFYNDVKYFLSQIDQIDECQYIYKKIEKICI